MLGKGLEAVLIDVRNKGIEEIKCGVSHEAINYLYCHGAKNGFLCDAANGLDAVLKIKFDRCRVPSKAKCNIFDQDAGIVQSNSHGDSIRVSHNVVNVQAHVVSRVGVGDDAGGMHGLLNVFSLEKLKGAGGQVFENSNGVVSRDPKLDGPCDDGDASLDGAKVGASNAPVLLNSEIGASLAEAKANV